MKITYCPIALSFCLMFIGCSKRVFRDKLEVKAQVSSDANTVMNRKTQERQSYDDTITTPEQVFSGVFDVLPTIDSNQLTDTLTYETPDAKFQIFKKTNNQNAYRYTQKEKKHPVKGLKEKTVEEKANVASKVQTNTVQAEKIRSVTKNNILSILPWWAWVLIGIALIVIGVLWYLKRRANVAKKILTLK